MKKRERNVLFLIVTATIMLANFSIDNFIPSIPFIAKDFGVNIDDIQLSFAIYTCGTIVSAFIFGLYTVKLKRRTLYFSSVLLAIFGSIFCAISFNSNALIAGRFLIGIGIGGMLSICVTIFTDIFKKKTLAKIMTIVVFFLSVVPAISPIVGGFIQEYLGWRMNFVLPSLLYVILIVIAYFYLSETTIYQNKDAKITVLIKKLFLPIKSISFISCTIASSIVFGAYLVYLTIGPVLYQVELHLSPIQFGSLSIFTTIAFLCSSMFNKYLLKRKSFKFILYLGTILSFIATFLLFIFYFFGMFGVFVILFPSVFYIFSSYLINVNAMPIAIMKTDNSAGTAAALFTFLQRILAAVMSMGAAYLPCKTQAPLGIVFLVIIILVVPLLWLIFRKKTTVGS